MDNFFADRETTPTGPAIPLTIELQSDVQERYLEQPPTTALHVLELARAADHPNGLSFVPQKTYRPHTLSDRRRYVEDVTLEEPIMFYSHDPDGCGISLRDAIAAKHYKLRDFDDPMFEGQGPSVAIRLNVGGLVGTDVASVSFVQAIHR